MNTKMIQLNRELFVQASQILGITVEKENRWWLDDPKLRTIQESIPLKWFVKVKFNNEDHGKNIHEGTREECLKEAGRIQKEINEP